ncbi:MAG TPA: hypothetical protein VEA58_01620 [Anaerovoracaceae bacterium]|nr:hypothetical protein [Anaerovoracaceae bacterium]
MWRDDLFQKKAWFESFNEKINLQLDEFYSTVTDDTGLNDREQYLYDLVQNQFKMLYELMDHSKEIVDTELMNTKDAIATRKNADTQM